MDRDERRAVIVVGTIVVAVLVVLTKMFVEVWRMTP